MRGPARTQGAALGPSAPGPKHQCRPSPLAGRPRAHGTPAGTEVTCPTCGRVWRVTKRHLDYHGRRGAVCGCGWALVRIDEIEEAA
jgi:hypothetical protein